VFPAVKAQMAHVGLRTPAWIWPAWGLGGGNARGCSSCPLPAPARPFLCSMWHGKPLPETNRRQTGGLFVLSPQGQKRDVQNTVFPESPRNGAGIQLEDGSDLGGVGNKKLYPSELIGVDWRSWDFVSKWEVPLEGATTWWLLNHQPVSSEAHLCRMIAAKI
jgi:hypothetical protein